ncbi:copper resistance protein CopC [Streptomyces sp. HNM0574]|uniref:copper resistance CopC/CopD family protein n=1 Tax=Streptomyces sp. HNM0574 TaxID=2714954 RepID=UPI00321756DC
MLCAALLCVLGAAAPASAHAALTDSNPAENSVVDSAPRQVVLSFSEGVSMSDGSLRVLGPDGERVDTGKVRDAGAEGGGGAAAKRATGLKSGLGKGTYTVAWQAVSADSHPVSGAFTFSIGAPSKTSAKVPEQTAGPGPGGGAVGSLYEVGRYAAYAGFVLLVGGALFALACRPRGGAERPVRRVVVTGWVTLAAATLALLLLRTPYTGSGRFADVLDLGGLRDVLGTKPGIALAARLLLLGAAALCLPLLFKARTGRALGLWSAGGVVALGLAATWAAAEHASTGIQPWLAMPMDVVHLLAMAAWLGGLVALLTALTWGPPVESASVRRFSGYAFWSVAALAATGIYQSWRQVGSWDALTGTSYGRLLLVKVGIVAVLLLVARASRRWTSRLADPSAPVPAPSPAADAEPAQLSTATATTSGPARTAATETEPELADGTAPLDPDPVRAAQLARQRAAADDARRRRQRDADPERSGLRRSVLVEAGIAVVLLAVTTALTGTEPARTEAAAGDGASGPAAHEHAGRTEWPVRIAFDTGGPDGKGTAALRLTPGRTGDNTLRLTATAPDGSPVDAPEVKIAFTLPAKDIGPLPVTPEPVPGREGEWRAEDVQLPLPGTWKAAVTVRTSDIDQVTETRTVHIG